MNHAGVNTLFYFALCNHEQDRDCMRTGVQAADFAFYPELVA
jgi:hypothetical protein